MTKPVVLVHGAFLGAWAWSEVVEELAGHGVDARAVDLPSRGPDGTLASDAATVRAAVEAFDEPPVLVGHSYGGVVITEASAGTDAVAHLVYVCAALTDAGGTVGSLLASDPTPTMLGEGIRMVDGGPTAVLDPDTARTVAGHDVPTAVMDEKLPRLGRHNMAVFDEAATGLGHREHPSTYVLTTRDTVFSPDLQRSMAERATHCVELDAAHFPMFSAPAELASIIARLAA